MRIGHKQIPITLRNGIQIQVDEGIKDLIKILNSHTDIETVGSYQGDDKSYSGAYVVFTGPAVLFMATLLTEQIWDENAKWRRRHNHECRGCRSFTVNLSPFQVGTIRLSWNPWDYKTVLRMAKKAMEVLRGRRELAPPPKIPSFRPAKRMEPKAIPLAPTPVTLPAFREAKRQKPRSIH
jgi:hypothetical protein